MAALHPFGKRTQHPNVIRRAKDRVVGHLGRRLVAAVAEDDRPIAHPGGLANEHPPELTAADHTEGRGRQQGRFLRSWVDSRWGSHSFGPLRHAVGLVPTERDQGLVNLGILPPQDGGGQQSGIRRAGRSDRQRANRNPPRHLHD